MTHRHLGIAEVSALVDLSRQRLGVLRQEGDFPPPADELSCGPIWHENDIRQWMATRNPHPGGRPRKPRDQP